MYLVIRLLMTFYLDISVNSSHAISSIDFYRNLYFIRVFFKANSKTSDLYYRSDCYLLSSIIVKEIEVRAMNCLCKHYYFDTVIMCR